MPRASSPIRRVANGDHSRWALLLVCLCMLAGSVATEGQQSSSPSQPATSVEFVLPSELPFLKLNVGDPLRMIGRYQGKLGDTITIEGTPAIIRVPAEQVFPTLRSPLLRDILLDLKLQVTQGSDAAQEFLLIDVIPGPSAAECFEARKSAGASYPVERRAGIAVWSLEIGRESGNDSLTAAARAQLLDCLKELAHAQRPGTNSSEAGAGLCWYRLGGEHLTEDPEWNQLLIGQANSQEIDGDFKKFLDEAGIARGPTGWRLRAELVREMGLELLDHTVVTPERARLERVIRESGVDEKTSLMLRALTVAQYLQHVKTGNLEKGMNRQEVIQAVGYPERLTWVQRRDRVYEAWFIPGHEVFFADGLVFSNN